MMEMVAPSFFFIYCSQRNQERKLKKTSPVVSVKILILRAYFLTTYTTIDTIGAHGNKSVRKHVLITFVCQKGLNEVEMFRK